MNVHFRNVVALICAMASLSASEAQKASHADTIRQMLVRLHDNGEFTGSVLVAKDGKPVYREAIGSTADESRGLLTRPSSIASLAKGFTAIAVMMLAERGKLRYDDSIASYVPELASAASAITIRHLLTHTSGIPDVGDLGIDRPDLRKRELIDAVRAQHDRFARPGAKYRYSNTGYMLLAMVVEKASGQAFDAVLRQNVFEPLGMKSTQPAGGSRSLDAARGEGGYVSTVDDLLKWDQALTTGTLVRASTFAEALKPAKVSEGTTTYGFGWNVAERNGDVYRWHTGNADGQRAFIGRRLGDRITVIILTAGDSRRLEIADAIVDILHDRPYQPPRLSIARRLLPVIDTKGIEAALALHEQLRTNEERTYDFSEPELNGLGYSLLNRGSSADAIRVFELNTQRFPSSSNAFDSLGEALARAGKRDEAVRAYTRAVELDANNLNAQTMLRQLTNATRK
jgi:CubicO group peptidase (beta-lactamase class C family)